MKVAAVLSINEIDITLLEPSLGPGRLETRVLWEESSTSSRFLQCR